MDRSSCPDNLSGRTIADVLLPDGSNVNHELVKNGWCWWYRKYVPGDVELEKLEKEAREAKKGLWVDPAPIPPWVYRKGNRRLAHVPAEYNHLPIQGLWMVFVLNRSRSVS